MIRFLKLYERFGIVIFILIAAVLLAIASPNFLKADTLLNIVAQGTYAAIVGFGMTLAITSGGFDLSVESVMSLVSVSLALLFPLIGIPLSIPVVLVVAASVGALNGVIIAKLKVSPLITTLSIMTIMKGVALLVAGGRQIVIAEKQFMELGTGKLGGIPIPIYIMIFFFILFYVILYHTPLGRHISAVGSNENAARISGVKVDGVKIMVYTLVAFTSGVASVIRAGGHYRDDPGRDEPGRRPGQPVGNHAGGDLHLHDLLRSQPDQRPDLLPDAVRGAGAAAGPVHRGPAGPLPGGGQGPGHQGLRWRAP
jgi:ribose/xylose/arabinose/galactoside ABC-type transport system permease subunit